MKLLFAPVLALAQIADATEFCEGKKAGSTHVTETTNCKNYIRCGRFNRQYTRKCAAGTVYDPVSGRCDHELLVPSCAPEGAFCAGKAQNSFHENPDDDTCTTFYHCGNTYQPYTKSCAKPLRWNDAIKACDYASNVECKKEETYEFSTGISGISDLIKTAFEEAKTESILSWGCHCARLNTNEDFYRAVGGDPIDELDVLCRDWIDAKNCINKMNGACDLTSEMWSVTVVNEVSTCENLNVEECTGAACAIDKEFIYKLMDITKNFTFNKKMPFCQRSLNGQPKDSCCGVWPSIKTYSSEEFICVDGEVKEKTYEEPEPETPSPNQSPQDCNGEDEIFNGPTKSCWNHPENTPYYIHVSPMKMNYATATDYCKNLGPSVQMVTPQNQEQMTYVTRYIRSKSDYEALQDQNSEVAWFHGWFGWTRTEDDKWETENGYELGVDLWCEGEPNNYQNYDENCIVAHVGDHNNGQQAGCWNDINCGWNTYAVCIYEENTPAPEQTEEDCRSDEIFHQESGSCWKLIDGDYFHVSPNLYNKQISENYCKNIGENVFAARYESAHENSLVFEYLKSRSNYQVLKDQGHELAAYQGWFGYVRTGPDSFGATDGNLDLPDTAWCSGEPNNWNNAEDCVVGQVEGRCFNDMGCDYQTHAICEYRA